MNILYQFNDKYAPYAGVSMTSLFNNNKDVSEITVWVLGEGLSKDSISKFNELSEKYKREIKFVDTDELIAKVKSLDIPSYRGSYAANFRLFVSEIFPKDIDRAIYLDSDTIINGNIERLHDYDLCDCTIGMVYDSVGEKHKKEIGLKDEDGYYNSGVILYDMNKWREKNYTEAIVEHAKNVRAQYSCPDQDLINVVCKGDICTLPASFNFQPFHQAYSDKVYFGVYGKTIYYDMQEIQQSRNDVVIYHAFRFLGEFPWNKNNYHPYNDIFDDFMMKTPWKDQAKLSGDINLLIAVEKMAYRIFPKGLFLGVFDVVHRLAFQIGDKKLKKKNSN